MGANLTDDGAGAVFRCWGPRAGRIWVSGTFNDWRQDDASELNRRGDYFCAYIPGVKDGDEYKFFVEGAIGGQYKRDPYARELGTNPAYPYCNCVVRSPANYPWSDAGWRTPPLNDLVIYQLHVGTFNGPDRANRVAKFLDVLGKLDYLAALGINAVQLLPIVEFASGRSRGYEGSDLFSPEMDYCVPEGDLPSYMPLVNGLRARTGLAPLSIADLVPQANQLKAMVDLFHRWGVAIIIDVVYNHVGGQIAGQAESFWNFEQAVVHSFDDSSYNSSRDHTGPCFALWKAPVRQFLIDNARFFLREFHVDGFRYDQVSAIVSENQSHGWEFCQALSGTVRTERASSGQIAEYWNVDPYMVREPSRGGAGFDHCLHDAFRSAMRDALSEAAHGGRPDMSRICRALWPSGFDTAWRVVQCIENHDEVDFGRGERISKLGDPGNARSWWARSRARVANALLLTAPGVPMIFMGQELLEDKQWSNDPVWHPGNLIWWDGLDFGRDPVQRNFHRFMEAIVRLRRDRPALRSEALSILHANNANGVLAFHRWLPGIGRDLVVVACLNGATLRNYELGWPRDGHWNEIFNSDAFDDYAANGNHGGIDAWAASRDGFSASARLTIPANSVLVFERAA